MDERGYFKHPNCVGQLEMRKKPIRYECMWEDYGDFKTTLMMHSMQLKHVDQSMM
jgi:hypothetical protein